jgi:hypothetical protein
VFNLVALISQFTDIQKNLQGDQIVWAWAEQLPPERKSEWQCGTKHKSEWRT